MEKLTIKPWQVMQAYENGADVDSYPLGCSVSFQENRNPKFDWSCFIYRIANLTADGMRLDELLEKHCAKDDCKLVDVLKSKEYKHLFAETSNSYGGLLSFLIEHPECIAQVKVKKEKKLRPLTMEEFEKYRDEWLCDKHVAGKYRILSIHENGVFIGRNGKVSYEYLLNNYTKEDGSPCGVLE